MTLSVRALLALLLAAWFTLPSTGDDGGENAGGTGVWILPRSTYLAASVCADGAPREAKTFTLAGDIVLALSSEVGEATATWIDEVAGVAVSLPVSGGQVRVPAALLQALGNAPLRQATVVIADASHAGYVIEIEVAADGTVTVGVM